jgi:phosphoribosylaminoimidazolecarboxamide formyltransferase/IMP cyclohydrolase
MKNNEIALRYGCNPHQSPARIFTEGKPLPIRIVSGTSGYINLCDALNSWQLVKELKQVLDLPAAASFKHVSPAGAAVGLPMSELLKKASFVNDLELSPLATAYARARGADRMSSFGDWAVLSDPVDVSTAKLIKREVSDGIIAPGYDSEALEILKEKRGGRYNIVEIDPDYTAPESEKREIFGITFDQKRNNLVPGFDLLTDIVTNNKELPDSAKRDLIISMISLKYTQSISVCYTYDGQIIGVGAGQQSRIHCTRLAGLKAARGFLRQHPAVLDLKFKENIKRAEQNNAIDQYLEESLTPAEEKYWKENFKEVPEKLSDNDKREWLNKITGVSLGSDAFFPFRDNIDRAKQSGVSYIIQPGGSVRDDIVIEACNEYNLVMIFTKIRLFHH